MVLQQALAVCRAREAPVASCASRGLAEACHRETERGPAQRTPPRPAGSGQMLLRRPARQAYSTHVPGQPLAYFITFRCYGTWLPGDERGTDRWHGRFDAPLLPPNRGLAGTSRARMRHAAVRLDEAARFCVESAVRETCCVRGWALHAVNVRTNHVHVVVSAPETPEWIMNTLKSWSTRALRTASILDRQVTPWSRHGSTRYLWNERDVEDACTYVMEAQDR
jgi:REP element-mobilizing transposase RayT